MRLAIRGGRGPLAARRVLRLEIESCGEILVPHLDALDSARVEVDGDLAADHVDDGGDSQGGVARRKMLQ